MEIFDLTKEQMRAFNRLKKAYKDCEKEGIYFVNRYGNLYAYDSKYIDGFGTSHFTADSENEVSVMDCSGDINSLKIANEWTDDDGEHYYGMTKKGFELYKEECGGN